MTRSLSAPVQLGRGRFDSQRTLQGWLGEDNIALTSTDLSPALVLLQSTKKIGRDPEKGNSARAGWLLNGEQEPVYSSTTVPALEPVEDATSPVAGSTVTHEAPEPVESSTAPLTDEQRFDALATAIIQALGVGLDVGRGYQGNRALCESEAVLRAWLHSDGVIFDEADLPAAFQRLETATLPGSNFRLLRGYALHHRYPITAKPLTPRAMLLTALHPMDLRMYEPADIEPYVV